MRAVGFVHHQKNRRAGHLINHFLTAPQYLSHFTVGGDLDMYRSVANFGNGVRLLGSRLTVNSRDGHGRFFDEILLNTLGLGNDNYQAAVLRIQKNSLYRYDMTWRLNAYYNPGLTIAGGSHLNDTIRRMQDHNLVLLPQSKFRFNVGYSRNGEDGPALSTALQYDARVVCDRYFVPALERVKQRFALRDPVSIPSRLAVAA